MAYMGPPPAEARLGPVDELDLRPVFQPIVDLRDGAVVGYEALARGPVGTAWENPAALFQAAYRTGRVPELVGRTGRQSVRNFSAGHVCWAVTLGPE